MKEVPQGLDVANEEEFASQSTLLKEFASLPTIDKAWVLESENGGSSRAMFSISQPNLLGNNKRTHILSSHIAKQSDGSVSFQWAPFPVEMSGVSAIVPSPSGQKMLVIRNQENDSPTHFEIWGPSQMDKEIHIPKSVHGSVYTDGWFEGISWSLDEILIAYAAEDPCPSKPVFDGLGYRKRGSTEKDCSSWKGQGDFEGDWGEAYSGKRRPGLFVVNIVSGDVHIVDGISKSLSVGQVIWAPKNDELDQYLVFVGWPSGCGSEKIVRRLGIKYCYNRPCALYAVKASFHKSATDKLETKGNRSEDKTEAINLTQGMSSAFFPRFSPDGKFLVFLSAKSAVDTGAHMATDSLHRIDWPTDGKPQTSLKLFDVVPVVQCAEEDCFPGLYCSGFLRNPWLSDGRTMIMSSYWRSSQVIVSVDVLSGRVSRVTPNSSASWNILALDGDNILSVSSSPVEPPEIKYGYSTERKEWNWLDISGPVSIYSTKVKSMLSSLQFSIMKIPVHDTSVDLTEGARTPYEAIFVSSKTRKIGACDPLVVILHGGPHSASSTDFNKNHAFLSTLGYSLLIVNYRGTLGFGEEALQSLPGKVGSQDVSDVLAALDHVIEMGLADPSKVAVVGISHGGFLTTHLIGQAPDRFAAAAARNPVCNLALMVGTSDIPDWCYVGAYGCNEGKNYFTEAPSFDHLRVMYNKSPISHLVKVKTPTLFLLGAQDLRVPVSDGLQYARALKENGVEVKVMMFPKDIHEINRPRSDFESFLNIGVWFNKHFQFEGISWSSDESLIAYIAEDPCPSKPVFDGLGYKKRGCTEKDCNSWKGQGDFEEEWGEAYFGKRRPGLFVVNIVSGDVHIVDGIPKSLNVGQVVWAPKNDDLDQYLVFVGWPSDCGSEKIVRKLGIKYCYNRPCTLYAVKASVYKSETDKLETKGDRIEDKTAAVSLTQGISSAFFPRFSPDGKSLVFLSAKSAVDTGAHSATNSLHRIDWPTDGKPNISLKLIDVVPVVKCPEEDCFPGLYCSSFLRNPWLSDGKTMIMSSFWRSSQVIVSIDVLSGRVSRVTPNSSASWDVLALDGDSILSVSSSPVEPPEIKYGYSTEGKKWNWLDISTPVSKYSTKVRSMLSSLQFSIMKIPVRDASVELTDGARTPYEAIFVSSKTRKSGACDPLIVILHGGPHFLMLTNFSKNHAFLSALGYSLLIVNYRGSLGFGEEALQSILGNVGSQDVNDVLAALDHVIEMGLADPSKVAVVGGSHGGFLTTHLIGQAPDRFVAAAARNPVCNLALMVGTTDIPDWCYVLAYEAPSLDHLHVMYNKSPISHLAKVKTPTLFLLGAQDLRVPVSNGLQYARALKENGVEVKVIVFPKDTHGIDRPQSEFESFLNIGVWFNKHFQ
ncbi:hypothetical protein MKW92_041230 [Papaver armeniacum]|nr:hypothetical protein MKW92_041230 [Papaver armeniacum]